MKEEDKRFITNCVARFSEKMKNLTPEEKEKRRQEYNKIRLETVLFIGELERNQRIAYNKERQMRYY